MLDKLERLLDYIENNNPLHVIKNSIYILISVGLVVGLGVFLLFKFTLSPKVVTSEQLNSYTEVILTDLTENYHEGFKGYHMRDFEVVSVTANISKKHHEVLLYGKAIYIGEGLDYTDAHDLENLQEYEYKIKPVIYQGLFDSKGSLTESTMK